MYVIDCPTCQTRRLAGYRQVIEVVSDATGIRMTARCHCGSVVSWMTGRRVGARRPSGAAPGDRAA